VGESQRRMIHCTNIYYAKVELEFSNTNVLIKNVSERFQNKWTQPLQTWEAHFF